MRTMSLSILVEITVWSSPKRATSTPIAMRDGRICSTGSFMVACSAIEMGINTSSSASGGNPSTRTRTTLEFAPYFASSAAMLSLFVRGLSRLDTVMVYQVAASRPNASAKPPVALVGLPQYSSLLLGPDSVPSTASRMGSATPDASSTTNSILSSWKPCIFSGLVAVRATANQRFS